MKLLFKSYIIILILNGCLSADANNEKKISDDRDRVKGEYIIKLKPNFGEDAIRKVMNDFDICKIETIGDRLYKIKLNKDPGPEKISKIAKKSECIEYAEPNYIYRINPPKKREK
jgi:hypothetical protein